jgi:transcriptional antiterminator
MSILTLSNLFTDTERAKAADISFKGYQVCKHMGFTKMSVILGKKLLGLKADVDGDLVDLRDELKVFEEVIRKEKNEAWIEVSQWLSLN